MYNLFLGSQPQKFLRKAEKQVRVRIWDKLDKLKINPFPSDVKRVVGKREKGFRVRVGDYRIQYYVFQDKKEIVVFDVDKRPKAY